MVLLLYPVRLRPLGPFHYSVNDLAEIGRRTRFHLFKSLLVCIHQAIDAFNLRIEYVSCECETITCIMIGDHFCTKTISCNPFSRVVVLQNSGDRFDSLQVFVVLAILNHTMQIAIVLLDPRCNFRREKLLIF